MSDNDTVHNLDPDLLTRKSQEALRKLVNKGPGGDPVPYLKDHAYAFNSMLNIWQSEPLGWDVNRQGRGTVVFIPDDGWFKPTLNVAIWTAPNVCRVGLYKTRTPSTYLPGEPAVDFGEIQITSVGRHFGAARYVTAGTYVLVYAFPDLPATVDDRAHYLWMEPSNTDVLAGTDINRVGVPVPTRFDYGRVYPHPEKKLPSLTTQVIDTKYDRRQVVNLLVNTDPQ